MIKEIKTLEYIYFTDEDRVSIKKWAKENEISLKEIADKIGYNYKHFIHVIGGRKTASEYALNKLKKMGWSYEIYK